MDYRACIASVFGLVARVQYYYGIDSDPLRIVVPLHATTMAEMTAGIVICCGPSAAIVFRALRERPIAASSTSQSSRLAESLGDSRSRSTTQKKEAWPPEQPVTGPRGGWTDVDIDSYSPSPLRAVHVEGTGKTTEFNITRTEYLSEAE